MNTTKILSLLLAVFAYGQLIAAPYEALVVAVTGTAFEVDGNEQAIKTLSPNATIAEGNGVRTGAGASITLVLANGAVISLEPESLVYMEQLQLDGDPSLIINKPLTPSPADTRTRLRISRGEILGEVKGLSARSKFEIASPVGTAGITGTKFSIELRSLGGNRYSLVITNLDGTVDSTANTDGAPTSSVEAGDQVVITATYDSETGVVSDVEVVTESLPATTVETLIDGVSEKVDDIVEEIEAGDATEVYLPIELIESDDVNNSTVIVIGTNT